MRRTVLSSLAALAVATVALAPSPAAAESPAATPVTDAPAPPTASPAPTPAPLVVGARVGGYGFRRPGAVDEHGHVAWDDCRMNGLGVFARRPLGRLFAEAGADLYFAESFPMAPAPGQEEMDRVSGLLTVAIGADLLRTRHVVAYAQLGAGLELTGVAMAMPDGSTMRDRRALPLGFLGVGGELKLGARTAIGAGLRAHVMGQFEHYGHDHTATAAGYDDGDGIPVSPEIAAQGLFHVSYRL